MLASDDTSELCFSVDSEINSELSRDNDKTEREEHEETLA